MKLKYALLSFALFKVLKVSPAGCLFSNNSGWARLAVGCAPIPGAR